MKLEPSTDSTFDYWLKVSTLDKGYPLLVPVKLASYHVEALTDPRNEKAPPDQQQCDAQQTGRGVVVDAFLR